MEKKVRHLLEMNASWREECIPWLSARGQAVGGSGRPLRELGEFQKMFKTCLLERARKVVWSLLSFLSSELPRLCPPSLYASAYFRMERAVAQRPVLPVSRPLPLRRGRPLVRTTTRATMFCRRHLPRTKRLLISLGKRSLPKLATQTS